MRARITLAMVLILVVALLLAGAISFTLVRNADKQNAIQTTLTQVQALVGASKASPFLKSLESNPKDLPDLKEVIDLVGQVAGLESAGTLVIVKGHLQGSPPFGISVSDLNLADLTKGVPVAGSVGDLSFAAAPLISLPETLGGMTIAIVLVSQITFSSDSVKYFALAAVIALVVAVLGTLYTTKRISNHVVKAAKAAQDIAAGDLNARVETSKGDYPELVALESAINTMAEKVSQARQLERQFLLSISHDLRTPLTSIRGFAEAIADNLVPDPAKAAQVLLAETTRLERLIRDLLDLAYLEAKRFSLRLEPVNLSTCIRDVADAFDMEAQQWNIRISCHIEKSGLVAMADRDRLSQVIGNLVQNSLKFATGRIQIELNDVCSLMPERKNISKPGHNSPVEKFAYIAVVDDGSGIAKEDLPHVFERLYTSDRGMMRSSRGTGLGLAIVKELTEAMGGEVVVFSPVENGAGTAFVVILKLDQYNTITMD
ncbi:MAG: HAMP domain-containing histidine kinase [Firmicutes bacterium]|jgi:signal transduction histidine kinase|nr:HAMP domain-containing histidine kinase [Bacillota bacterium]